MRRSETTQDGDGKTMSVVELQWYHSNKLGSLCFRCLEKEMNGQRYNKAKDLISHTQSILFLGGRRRAKPRMITAICLSMMLLACRAER